MGVAIRQRTVCSCIPIAIDRSIANRWTWHHRVLKRAFERLERLPGKLVRAVLRGLGGSNPAWLPGQIEKVGDCSYRVFAYLERLAAQGELIYQDDTSVRILSLIGENLKARAEAEALGLSRSKERTGMYTTALVVQVGERTICLYYSGRAHAGENLQALLEQRQANLDKPLVMSDALSHNEADETTLIRCHCLAHGRRQFSDLQDVFPQECRVVIEALKQVFDHEAEARDRQMSPAARFAYHQAYSRPIMDELHRWLDQQVEECLVEPNSALGKAIAYMQGHWETLT